MRVYDKAKYHYSGDFPPELSPDQAFVHTGMFLGWIIDHELYSGEFSENCEEQIAAFRRRLLTGPEVYKYCDGVFAEDMLNEEGNAFAAAYFDFDTGQYVRDYEEVLGRGLPSIYHVQDTWDNYNTISQRIDERRRRWSLTEWQRHDRN